MHAHRSAPPAGAVADPGFLERGGRAGEWPKATRAVGRGEGVSPSPLGWGLGRGCAAPQKNFEILLLKLRILVYSG